MTHFIVDRYKCQENMQKLKSNNLKAEERET